MIFFRSSSGRLTVISSSCDELVGADSTEPNDTRLLARVKLDFPNCLERGLMVESGETSGDVPVLIAC